MLDGMYLRLSGAQTIACKAGQGRAGQGRAAAVTIAMAADHAQGTRRKASTELDLRSRVVMYTVQCRRSTPSKQHKDPI